MPNNQNPQQLDAPELKPLEPQSLEDPAATPELTKPEEPKAKSEKDLKAEREKAEQAYQQALSHINTQSAVIATTAAKAMRKAMGVDEEHKGGPLGDRLVELLNTSLKAKAKAYHERTMKK